MKYVVTGATGHIGNTIVKYLLKEKKEVRVLLRKIDSSISNLDIEYCVGDVFNEQFLALNIEKDDVVIHLAGIIDIKNKLKEETYRINYLGTKLIADISLKKKAKQFIYFSSVDAIYKEDINKKISEPNRMYPDKLKDYYGISKALATNYILNLSKIQSSMAITVLYPSAVIGINDFKPSYIGKVVSDVIKNKMEFGIDGGYDFVDVEDIARFTLNVVNNNLSGSYILSGTRVTVKQMYQALNFALNKEKKILKLPTWIVYLAMPFVPYLSKFTLKTLREMPKYDCSKALNVGYKITPFMDTIKNSVEFHKKRIEKVKQDMR